MTRYRRKCTEYRHRVHPSCVLIAMAYAGAMTFPVTIRNRESICEKHEVELSALKQSSYLDIVGKAQKVSEMLRIAPDRVAMNHRACDHEPA
jgi:hypothetical protein